MGGAPVGRIGQGLVVLVGCRQGDGPPQAEALARKVAHLRIFEDDRGLLGRSVLEVRGAILAVPQFTLYGDCRKGRRPSFALALAPEPAEALYERFLATLRAEGVPAESGRFRTTMEVELVNDGPVTLIVDVEAEA